jgi:hypothetical protein
MAAGQLAGLTFLGGAVTDNYIGLRRSASGTFLEAVGAGIVAHGPGLVASVLWLRAEYDFGGASCFSFSLDGERFLPLGGPCELRFGYWKGARIGLFTYQTSGAGGIVDAGSFRYDHDGPPYANLDSR